GLGQGILSGAGSNFHVGFLGGDTLAFVARDHQSRTLEARISASDLQLDAGVWHEVIASWQGFNEDPRPAKIEVKLGRSTAVQSAEWPHEEPFYSKPNTSIWVGSAVQTPRSRARVDTKSLHIL